MNVIQSGPTTERVIRTGLLALLLTGYAIYSLYDGYLAYPKENVRTVFQKKLGTEPPVPLPPIQDALDRALVESAGTGSALTERLGADGVQHERATYYFGPGGFAVIAPTGEVTWEDGPEHSGTDILLQKAVGYILLPLGLVLLLFWVIVIRTRAKLDDAGLSMTGYGHIPFDAMRGLQRGDNIEEVILEYERDGKPSQARLHRYKLKKQPEIVAAICAKKGFTNPDAPNESKDDSLQ